MRRGDRPDALCRVAAPVFIAHVGDDDRGFARGRWPIPCTTFTYIASGAARHADAGAQREGIGYPLCLYGHVNERQTGSCRHPVSSVRCILEKLPDGTDGSGQLFMNLVRI
jgi:hypothetical protein